VVYIPLVTAEQHQCLAGIYTSKTLMKLEPPQAVLEALQAEQILGPRRLNRLLAEVGLVWQLTPRDPHRAANGTDSLAQGSCNF
jgi:hypothetical protein